jgi:ferric-dicitrate binding protein FerR (iron transport regulator)
MRPDLPLEVELSAGTLRTDGITGPLRFDVQAGSARIEHARGPLEATVAAGSIRVEAMLTEGSSRIRCDASSVRVHLERGSSVVIRARANLSKLSLPDRGVLGTWSPGEREEVKIGDGAATLDIDANMSNISVTADQ